MRFTSTLKRKKENNQKLVETLGQLWDHFFDVTSRRCDSLKKIFPAFAQLQGQVHMLAGIPEGRLLGLKRD
jgi:hypothetical protein